MKSRAKSEQEAVMAEIVEIAQDQKSDLVLWQETFSMQQLLLR